MIIQLILGALMIGAVYGLVGLGYGLIYKASGLMSLAQGDMLMFGAFLGITFYKVLELPYFLALIIVMLIMFLIGFLMQKILVTSLLKKGAQTVYVVLCTIAVSMLLQNIAMIGWGSNTLQFPSLFKNSTFKIGSVNIVPEYLLAIIFAVVCMVGLHLFMTKSKFGTSMRAAAQDEMAAESLGINVSITKGASWGIASMLAGTIGMIIGPVFGVYISMGIMVGQKGFASAVVGGYGNMYGAIIGGVFFGITETFISAFVTSTYKDVISFILLIIALIFMPTGILKEQVME